MSRGAEHWFLLSLDRVESSQGSCLRRCRGKKHVVIFKVPCVRFAPSCEHTDVWPLTSTDVLSGNTGGGEGKRAPVGHWNVRMRTLFAGTKMTPWRRPHGCVLGLEEMIGRDLLGLMEGKGHTKAKG